MKMRHLLFSAFLTGCGATHSGPGDTGTASFDGGSTTVPEDCTSIPEVRGLSASCCSAWGVDACGPGLFCAAFDGRTVEACYPLGSRKSGESCTADEQCQKHSCDPTAQVCRPVLGEACTESVGCAAPQVCVATCTGDVCSDGTCKDVELFKFCASAMDCWKGAACDIDHRCKWPADSLCHAFEATDCAGGQICCPIGTHDLCVPASACP